MYSQFLPETLTAFFTKDAAVVAMAAEYLRGYSIDCIVAVSYTHLDVYKRQAQKAAFVVCTGFIDKRLIFE